LPFNWAPLGERYEKVVMAIPNTLGVCFLVFVITEINRKEVKLC